MKLTGVKEYTGKIVLQSGLHIGAGDAEMRIGGTDNPVIKHPHTHEPYIPGSSLKGKVRSLLELRSGLIGQRNKVDGGPLSLKDYRNAQGEDREACAAILKLFGVSGADQDEAGEFGPSRASFADCGLDPEWRKAAFEKNITYTEVKSETAIDRISGTALNRSLHSTERVPADTQFSFSITVKQMKGDENLEKLLFQGLKLLELDALGGSGSRGYGRVKFLFNDPADQEAFESITPF